VIAFIISWVPDSGIALHWKQPCGSRLRRWSAVTKQADHRRHGATQKGIRWPKLLLEEGYHETIEAAKSLDLEGIFETVRVLASKAAWLHDVGCGCYPAFATILRIGGHSRTPESRHLGKDFARKGGSSGAFRR
jgi:hypothetical protein